MMIALGDTAERVLRTFGITKARVQAINAGRDCGCVKRQEAMNAWGFRFQQRLIYAVQWTLHRWQLLRYGRVAMRLSASWHHLKMAVRVLVVGP